MAGCAHIQHSRPDSAVLCHVQHRGNQVARVQRHSLARLQVNLQLPLFLCPADQVLQPRQIIILPGNVMSAAHVQPLHPGQHVAEAAFHRLQGRFQGVGVLLAQRMEMQAVQQFQQFFRHFPDPGFPRHAQAAALRAGIVDFVPLLGGAFRIDPQPDAFSAVFRPFPEPLQLVHGIEHDMVRIPQQLFEFILPVGSTEDVHLFSRHLLSAEPGFIQAAGLSSGKIRSQERIEIIVGEGFLGKQDPAPGAFRHRGQDPAVFLQPFFINHIAWRPEGGKAVRRVSADKPFEYFSLFHQSTRTGLWFSLRGRP